jgi:hypothetical protein
LFNAGSQVATIINNNNNFEYVNFSKISILDNFYDKIPDKNAISQEMINYISESISVNTNYSTIIEV